MIPTKDSSEIRLLGFDISKQPLTAYFILTYAITWLFTIPAVYCYQTIFNLEFSPWLLLFLPGAYGPTIAALIMTRKLEGKAGVKRLINKLLVWRVHWKWYLFVLLLPLLWVVAAILISDFRSIALDAFSPASLITAIPIYLLVALPFGPLAEELGWRGFALPRLQTKYSPLLSSIILGIIWTFWHTPMFWFPGAAIPSFLELSLFSLFLYTLQIVSESIIITCVFNNTSGSVLLAVLFHTAVNASENIIFDSLPEPSYDHQLQVYLWTIAIMWLIALLCVFFKSGKVVKPE